MYKKARPKYTETLQVDNLVIGIKI